MTYSLLVATPPLQQVTLLQLPLWLSSLLNPFKHVQSIKKLMLSDYYTPASVLVVQKVLQLT